MRLSGISRILGLYLMAGTIRQPDTVVKPPGAETGQCKVNVGHDPEHTYVFPINNGNGF